MNIVLEVKIGRNHNYKLFLKIVVFLLIKKMVINNSDNNIPNTNAAIVQYCKGYTKTGKKCSRKIKMGKEYCHHHVSYKNFEKNECPVCFEEIVSTCPLSCGHWIHKKCVIRSGKTQCPMCRSHITNLTNKEIEQTHFYSKKYHQERIQEDEDELYLILIEEIVNEYLSIDNNNNNTNNTTSYFASFEF